jgi:hypothetical protein
VPKASLSSCSFFPTKACPTSDADHSSTDGITSSTSSSSFWIVVFEQNKNKRLSTGPFLHIEHPFRTCWRPAEALRSTRHQFCLPVVTGVLNSLLIGVLSGSGVDFHGFGVNIYLFSSTSEAHPLGAFFKKVAKVEEVAKWP